MTNKNFGRNLLLALGSLGALLGAVNPNMSAMEGSKSVNEHDEKHKKFNEILDNANKIFNGPGRRWNGSWYIDWTPQMLWETSAEVAGLGLEKNDLTVDELLRLKLFIEKATRWIVRECNYGIQRVLGVLIKSGPVNYPDWAVEKLQYMWHKYFYDITEFENVISILEKSEEHLQKYSTSTVARDTEKDIDELNKFIGNTYKQIKN